LNELRFILVSDLISYLKSEYDIDLDSFDGTLFYSTFVIRLKLIAMNTTLLFLQGVGFQEILLIGLFVLVFFGAKKIPEFMKGLGKGVREFKDSVKDVKKEVEDANNAAKIEDGK
jgi:sec-independent protein translocase protein TatA